MGALPSKNTHTHALLLVPTIQCCMQPERQDTTVVFWDLVSDTRYSKHMRNVKAIRAAGEHVACFLAVRAREALLDNQMSRVHLTHCPSGVEVR
jgi:hypothetical protein